MLAGLSRRTALPSSSARLRTVSELNNVFPTLQKRGKAGIRPRKKAYSPNKGAPRLESTQKEKKLGAFVALPPKGLGHAVFRSSDREALELPTFAKDPIYEAQAMAFAAGEDDPMRKFGLPRSMLLEFRLLSRPCSVVRKTTTETLDILNAAKSLPSKDTRAVFTGPSGCGKSFLLLQALEYCVQQNWIVMYVPRAINLVNSSSTYSYDMRTQVYTQPSFAYQTLQRLLGVNGSILNAMQTSKDVEIERRSPIKAGTSLAELVRVGTQDQSVASTVLEAVLAELGSQEKHPVLLAIDDFQAIFCTSTYRDPLFSRIKPWHLSMPRLLLQYASGQKSFARGAVLGAVSSTNPQFMVPLELREALAVENGQPAIGGRVPRSKTLQDYARGLRNIAVPAQLSVDEAATLFEVWMKDKALYGVSEAGNTASDETFLAKYSETSGNAREFVQRGLLRSLSYTGGAADA